MNKIYLLLILLILSCNSENHQEYPAHPDPGIWSSGSSEWVAHYSKPSLLQPQPENPNVLVSTTGDLRLRLEKLPDHSDLSELREAALNQLSCQDGLQHDVYINCSLGFQKMEQQYGQYKSLSLLYFGNIQSSTSSNTLLFIKLNQDSVKVEIEGDASFYQDNLTELFQTLTFRLENINSHDTDQKGF